MAALGTDRWPLKSDTEGIASDGVSFQLDYGCYSLFVVEKGTGTFHSADRN